MEIKVLTAWQDESNNKITDPESYTVTKTQILTAVTSPAVYYTVTIHQNNGQPDWSHQFPEGTASGEILNEYAMSDYYDSRPEGAEGRGYYVDAGFVTGISKYLYEKGGLHEDLDLYIKWIYGGGWIEKDGFFYYYYTDGTFAKEQLIRIINDETGSIDYYYVDSDGHRITNQWYSAALNGYDAEEAGYKYEKYYFGSDGVAYKNGIYEIDGHKYLFSSSSRMACWFADSDGNMITPYQYGNDVEMKVYYAEYYCGPLEGANGTDPTVNEIQSGWASFELPADYDDTHKAGSLVYLYFDTETYRKTVNMRKEIDGVTYAFDMYGVSDKDPVLNYTISFDANGHGTAPEAITAAAGSAIKPPTEPTADGYTFVGWYEDAAGAGKLYEFKTMPSQNLTLYAKWEVTTNRRSMYRMYNKNSGEHFYTASATERDTLVNVGWNYEGIAWTAPAISGTPVYRLFNPYAKNTEGTVVGDHHYTTSADERDMLTGIGWQYEGIGWYSDGPVALFRLYNPYADAGSHHYTPSEEEKSNLVAVGWKYEGISWFGL